MRSHACVVLLIAALGGNVALATTSPPPPLGWDIAADGSRSIPRKDALPTSNLGGVTCISGDSSRCAQISVPAQVTRTTAGNRPASPVTTLEDAERLQKQPYTFRRLNVGSIDPRNELNPDSLGAYRTMWTEADIAYELGDIDGDGDIDYVGAATAVRIYLNNGAGRFERAEHAESALPTPSSLTMADYDGDGDLDFFVDGSLYRNNFVGYVQSSAQLLAITVGRVNLPCAGDPCLRPADLSTIAAAHSYQLTNLVEGSYDFTTVPTCGVANDGVTMPNPSAVFRVVITEVAVVAQTNCGTCADDYVELYNAGTATADISGFWVCDQNGCADSGAYEIPAGTIIASGDYLLLCKGTDFTFDLTAGPGGQLTGVTLNSARAPSGGDLFTDVTSSHSDFAHSGFGEPQPTFGDINGDGKLDLLVYDAGSATAPKIYEMSSGGTYTTKSITALAGLASTNLAWKDIDNDGRPDLIDFSGNRVYLNDATQSFAVYIDLPSGMALTNLPSGMTLIKSGLGDFDNDGDVDFLAWDSGANKVYLVRNNGLSGLNPEETILPNAAFVIADVDTDGDLDLYKGGDYAWNPPELHTNDGNGIFTRNYKSTVGNEVLKADGSATFFADLNGDGFTDVLAQGERQDADANRFWQTEIWLTQHTPVQIDKNVAASASLTAILRGMDLSPGSTPTAPHKYLLGPSADMNGDGYPDFPTVFAMGGSGTTLVTILHDGQGTFLRGGTVEGVAGVIALADFTGDGAVDVLGVMNAFDVSNTVEAFTYTRKAVPVLLANANDGQGTLLAPISLPSVSLSLNCEACSHLDGLCLTQNCLASFDVDGDGDMDLVDCNSKVHLNNGAGAFSIGSAAVISGPSFADGHHLAVADVDGDGDLDLLIGVFNGAEHIYLNDGAGTFAHDPRAHSLNVGSAFVTGTVSLPTCDPENVGYDGLSYWGPKWEWGNRVFPFNYGVFGDIDGDGDLDFGDTRGGNSPLGARFYRNDGTGIFDPWSIDSSKTPIECFKDPYGICQKGQSSTLVDLDGDGDLDYVFRADSKSRDAFYFNDGNGHFTRQLNIGLDWIASPHDRSLIFVDLDADGDTEIISALYPHLTQLEGNLGQANVDVDIYVPSFCPTGGRGPDGACWVCPSFARVSKLDGDGCFECPAHHIGAGIECRSCDPGYERAIGVNACAQVAEGSYGDGTGVAAIACPAGTFSASPGAAECTVCAAGTYISTPGATECDICPAGFYCEERAKKPVPCPAGRYSDQQGRTDDTCSGVCDPGYMCSSGATSATDTSGAPACTTSYYLATDDSGAHICTTCDNAKMDCTTPGATIEVLKLKAGMWRVSNTTAGEFILPCYNPVACLGAQSSNATSGGGGGGPSCVDDDVALATDSQGLLSTCAAAVVSHPAGTALCTNGPGMPGTTPTWFSDRCCATCGGSSGRRLQAALGVDPQSTYGDGLCEVGHTGPLCAVCGESGGTKYVGGTDATLCAPCGGNMGFTVFVLIVIVAVLLGAVVVFVRSGEKAAKAMQLAKDAAKKGVKATAKAEAMKQVNRAAGSKHEKVEGAAETSSQATKRRLAKGAAKGLAWTLWFQAMWKDLKVKVKILVSLYQILSGIGSNFAIPFPSAFTSTTSSVGGFVKIELPTLVPVGCIMSINYYSEMVFGSVWPLVVYLLCFLAAKALSKAGRDLQAGMLIDTNFFLMFLLYPGIATKLLSMFNCVEAGDGSEYMRVDLSLRCSSPDGPDRLYVFYTAFAIIMIILHVIGYPAVYAYLFFRRHRIELVLLRQQEILDAHLEEVAIMEKLSEEEKAHLKDQQDLHCPRVTKEELLPPYVQKLTDGYEYRTYWFEIFEMLRKVLLVGVPAMFPERGGNMQLVWGLLVCFITFGMYMMWAPFIKDSDDHLQQLAQLQIFISLVASLSLRATPPDPLMSGLVSALLFIVPLLGLAGPIYRQVKKVEACRKKCTDVKMAITV